MQVTLEHLETLGRIQRLQPGDSLVSDPKIIQDLTRAGFVRAAGAGVAITLDGTLWLAEHNQLLVKVD